jgi:tetratricopeptide (TPR) repeat protein
MASCTLSCEQLLALASDLSPERELVLALLEHHLEVCEPCRSRLAEGLTRKQPPTDLAGIVSRAVDLAQLQANRLSRLEATAQSEFKELLRLSPAQRRFKINRSFTRYKNPVLADLLVEESKRRVHGDPYEAYELAESAQDVALRLSHTEYGRPWAMTCLARAHAHRANALRVAGEMRRAETTLVFALQVFEHDGNADPFTHAELLSLVSALRREQRRFSEAETFLDTVHRIYVACGQWSLVAPVLITRGVLLFEACEVERAIEAVSEALELLDPVKDARTYLGAQHNLVDYLQEVGRFEEARERLSTLRDLYNKHGDRSLELRRQWVEGRIARGLGELTEAESILGAARKGFLQAKLPFDAALVNLDLALLYLAQNRTDEVQQHAAEAIPVFLAQSIHREAVAAVLLVQEALRRKSITTGMLSDLLDSLRRTHIGGLEAPAPSRLQRLQQRVAANAAS